MRGQPQRKCPTTHPAALTQMRGARKDTLECTQGNTVSIPPLRCSELKPQIVTAERGWRTRDTQGQIGPSPCELERHHAHSQLPRLRPSLKPWARHRTQVPPQCYPRQEEAPSASVHRHGQGDINLPTALVPGGGQDTEGRAAGRALADRCRRMVRHTIRTIRTTPLRKAGTHIPVMR